MRNLNAFLVLGCLPVVFSLTSGCSCSDGDDGDTGVTTGTGGSGGGGTGGDGNSGGMLFPTGGGGSGNEAGNGGAGGINEECIFVPPPGAFEPALDCAWDGPDPGSPYQGWDDVVSTPVVINLTDDNNDLMVNTNDIPDIAFISYRLESGGCPAGVSCGCCNSSGVLRVVSGECNDDGTMTEHFTIGPDEIEADGFPANIYLDSSGGLGGGRHRCRRLPGHRRYHPAWRHHRVRG